MPGVCPLSGVLCGQRSGPRPAPGPCPSLLPTAPPRLARPCAPPPQVCSMCASLRGAGPGPREGLRGGVNTCTGRTGNTCKAVSIPPSTQLQTTHIHRRFLGFSPRASQRISGRQGLATLPARRGEGSDTGVPDQARPPPRRGGAASPRRSEGTPRSRAPAGSAGPKSAHLGWRRGEANGERRQNNCIFNEVIGKRRFSRDGTGGGLGGGAAVVPHTHPRPPAHRQEPPCAGVVIIFVNFLSTVC